MTNTQAEVLDELLPLLARLHSAEHDTQPADGCVCCELVKKPRVPQLCPECAKEVQAAWLRILLGVAE